jgi:hypothetical protein
MEHGWCRRYLLTKLMLAERLQHAHCYSGQATQKSMSLHQQTCNSLRYLSHWIDNINTRRKGSEYRPNGRRWLGRPLKRLLHEAETGLLRPNSWRRMTKMVDEDKLWAQNATIHWDCLFFLIDTIWMSWRIISREIYCNTLFRHSITDILSSEGGLLLLLLLLLLSGCPLLWQTMTIPVVQCHWKKIWTHSASLSRMKLHDNFQLIWNIRTQNGYFE